MIRLAVIASMLLLTVAAHAQSDEDGLYEARLVGPDPVQAPDANPVLRPQLVANHSSTWRVVGGISLGIGLVAEVTSWAFYVARQNYRLNPRMVITRDNLDAWSTLRAVSFWTGVGASALLVAGEYLLLPEANGVPTMAWIAGAGGLGLAAVGVGFLAGGSHCEPTPVQPGLIFKQACTSGTSDALFGPLLLLASAPLLNIPLVFLLRDALNEPEPLSVGPGGVMLRGRF